MTAIIANFARLPDNNLKHMLGAVHMELDRQLNCKYCQSPSDGAEYCCEACKVLDTQVGPLNLAEANPFAYLDEPQFKALYKQDESKDYDYLIFAEGMHCSSCVHLLEKLPEFCPGILEARANFGQSTIAVKLSKDASLAKAVQSIAELGYTPKILSPEDNIQEKYKEENRTFLKRIAVAGFCAGNIMLFTIPIYAGLEGSWAHVFNAVGLALFLPILFYSAIPFYQGSVNALKFRMMNVDLPITIAMLSGFVFSTWNFIQKQDGIYYDSTASFLFLILSARYLLKRVQQNYLAPARMQTYFKDQTYERIEDSHTSLVPWNQIKMGDRILLKQGQTLPTDCELLSEQATVDLSLFNGESLPQVYSAGMTLLGGTQLLSESVTVRAVSHFEQSQIGKLFTDLDQKSYQKSDFVSLTDRLSQRLIAVVFGLAAVFAILYSFVNPFEAFQRALALIVVACPCALAFGSPLTLGLAVKKAQRLGILMKSANTFEKILNLKNVFFDKTGTLTEGNLTLVKSTPEALPVSVQQIVLALEAHSHHPVAFAIRKAWSHLPAAKNVSDVQEILGQGVRGYVGHDLYEVFPYNTALPGSQIAIEVLKNHRSLCQIFFADRMREDSEQIVKQLQARGLHTFLISGDKTFRAKDAAQRCNIPLQNAYGDLTPQAKFELIKNYSNTCMIGDGANDSLSLQNATVGIAVKGSVDLSLQHADIYFTRGGLQPLMDLFALTEKTRNVLARTLTVSLVYNCLGGAAALLGFINPMMAAILMPISSVLIVLTSLWGMR
ncbi:heavy metal translocating P-type ATPase [Bdellovibrio sp. SKB1291214]|uniref:heavy metal translocating P-type ATPase n=1 Tax=Bdellovibrio sp. SKB1291214 TaxID=1732569 RepID=UPI0020CD88FE|nr:heavy metal translocating P-type ATPase [Bdellovibrio sp. SKB1291214]UYL07769.1 heavy metal translocating P-type ATPase [Bdellovibrio sp. SKB1291214]